MKHLKLFENQSANSVRNAISIYKKFLVDMQPAVFEKYNKIAEEYDNDEDGELESPETGDKPTGTADNNWFYIEDVQDYDDGFEFFLNETDKDGNVESIYCIILTDEEINNAYIKIKSNKYNI
jgi:hypothetical protein